MAILRVFFFSVNLYSAIESLFLCAICPFGDRLVGGVKFVVLMIKSSWARGLQSGPRVDAVNAS